MSGRFILALAALLSISCATDSPRPPAAPPPASEFLIVAGDSTFWVRSDAGGVRVRGSSMLLGRIDGRFHEIYVADDDRSYYDAVFIGQRVYRRDIEQGDSSLVFDDATVPSLAHSYASTHPSEAPLGPDDDGAERPATVATTEVDILDVHGPFLSYEYRADLDVADGTDTHVMRRGVLDLRTGTRATLASIFGARAAAEIADAGRLAGRRMSDSVLSSSDPRAPFAAASLDAFRFDEESFVLADDGGEPVVAFSVPGTGSSAGGLAIPLPSVPAPRATWWADEVRSGLPSVVDDDGTERWRRAGYEVVARYDTISDRVALFLRDGRRREWPIGHMGAPVRHIYWLDRPQVGGTQRAALERAFDEAAFYGDDVRTVNRPGPFPSSTFRFASHRR